MVEDGHLKALRWLMAMVLCEIVNPFLAPPNTNLIVSCGLPYAVCFGNVYTCSMYGLKFSTYIHKCRQAACIRT